MRLRMIFLILVVLTFINITEVTAQTREELSEESIKLETKTVDDTSKSDKIDNRIIDWRTSSDPETFARNNNLEYSDGKIQVYVYLDSKESISMIPDNIDVKSSDGKIVIASVTSEDITQMAELGFVEKITEPKIAKTSPNPTIEERDEFSLVLPVIVVVIIGLVFTIIYFKKIAKNK